MKKIGSFVLDAIGLVFGVVLISLDSVAGYLNRKLRVPPDHKL